MTGRRAGLSAALACWGCAGGGGSSPAAPAPYDPESIVFAEGLGVDLGAMEVTPLGLYLEDLKVGEGLAAQRNHLVTLHYVGYLPDGTIFESSGGGEPIQFRLGRNEVIRGWDLGILGMQRGGIRRLVIRPSLGYRGQAKGRIPPNTTLVFDVQLLDVR
ncbi:MAG: FKBP-type peptidyl-prolyl cis-trans isomerase [Longimicrobiales bacterium]|nr:FKBP-type peptidyl-prolyl cis-trans isomerase [Longimicrobiales bacterium]